MRNTQDFVPIREDAFNILAIDPGSDTMGYGVLQVDIDTKKVVDALAWTVRGEKLVGFSQWNSELYSDRFARIRAHNTNLAHTLRAFEPVIVACEAPFYSRRRPTAFGVLLEVCIGIQTTVYDWDCWKPVHMVDPLSAKQAVGAKGKALKGKDEKDRIRTAVLAIPELQHPGTEDLDEHSNDAIAIAYCQLERFRKSDFRLLTI